MSDRVTDSLSAALTSLLAQRQELDRSIAELRLAAQQLQKLLPRRRRAVASVRKASRRATRK